LVSNARSGWGSRAHRNAIEDVSTGSFMLSLLLRTIRTDRESFLPFST
jgi:hypothetical protein